MAASTIEQIWHEYHSKLRNFIEKRVTNASMAEDILQDVFVKIISKRDTLNSEDKIHQWILQITRYAIIDYYRTRKIEYTLPDSPISQKLDVNDSASQEIALCLIPMIQRLPDTYREAILLSEINGLKQKQIAEKQNISLSGAKSRIQRGRIILKDLLLQCCRFEFDVKGKIIDYENKQGSCDDC